MVICPECGEKNPGNANYCQECGNKLIFVSNQNFVEEKPETFEDDFKEEKNDLKLIYAGYAKKNFISKFFGKGDIKEEIKDFCNENHVSADTACKLAFSIPQINIDKKFLRLIEPSTGKLIYVLGRIYSETPGIYTLWEEIKLINGISEDKEILKSFKGDIGISLLLESLIHLNAAEKTKILMDFRAATSSLHYCWQESGKISLKCAERAENELKNNKKYSPKLVDNVLTNIIEQAKIQIAYSKISAENCREYDVYKMRQSDTALVVYKPHPYQISLLYDDTPVSKQMQLMTIKDLKELVRITGSDKIFNKYLQFNYDW